MSGLRAASDELVGSAESGWEWEFLDKASGEKLVWSGGPEALGRLMRQAIPEALIGLVFIAFTLIWSISVVHGGHNNWDRGKVVAPFAPHNIGIATLACLWMLTGGFCLLTAPLRTWWKGHSTRYLLTTRRALICEPRIRGGFRMRSYSPSELGLMRCEEFGDGFGSLVFEVTKDRSNMKRPIGFLGIGQVWDVDSLVRRTLMNATATGFESQVDAVDEGGSPSLAKSLPKSYKLTSVGRMQNLLWIAICLVILTFTVAAVLTVPIVLLCVPISGPGASGGLSGLLPVWIALPVGALLGALIIGWFLRMAFRTPVKITINDQDEIELSNGLSTTVLRIQDLIAIQAGSWSDQGRHWVQFWHKGGKRCLPNQFDDFRDFLVTIKSLNPSVEIKGF